MNARFLDDLAREVCQVALYDPVLCRPPYFQADVPEKLRGRYRRRISEQQSRWLSRDNVFLPQALIHHTVQTLVTDAGVSPSTAQQLESVLPARLEWTSKQLLGS